MTIASTLSAITADTFGIASNGLSTALSTLTADGASPTSAHVSSAVLAQASIVTVLSTALSTQVSASTALSSALSTLTLDAGSPTSAHVSSAVSSFVIYQTALSVPNISAQFSSVAATGGSGGSAAQLLSTHIAAALRGGGGAGVQINLAADLSTALLALA
jgi:hypothetical protein